MCTYSMVVDHYMPVFPTPEQIQKWVTVPIKYDYMEGVTISGNPLPHETTAPPEVQAVPQPVAQPATSDQVEALRVLVQEVRDLLAAAKLLDDKLHQPDCYDPAKGDLESRVAAIEAYLAKGKARKPRKGRSTAKSRR